MANVNYLEIVQKTCDVLTENTSNWINKYNGYADDIIANKEYYKTCKSLFKVDSPLYRYSSIGKVASVKNTAHFDIRYAGQSVASISVNTKSSIPVKLSISEVQNETNARDFNFIDSKQYNGDWKAAKDFRRFFNSMHSTNISGSKSEEHRIENFMLAEFGKTTRAQHKKLCNIQPVKIADLFFQLTTPLSASHHTPSFSNKGGGIDILARVKHSDFRTRLAIIELKDDNKSSEPQCEVMKQALIYATFIAYLLTGEKSKKWWKIFGYRQTPKYAEQNLILDVVTLMPKGTSEEGPLNPIHIPTLPNVTLQPYTLYFDKDENGNPSEFYGTLKEDILQ